MLHVEMSMTPLTVARILFALWMINEAFVVIRSTPEERALIKLPRFGPLAILVLFIPLFLAIDYPTWVSWGLVALQALGLGLEVAGEYQLTRAKSFSIAAGTPDQFQTRGLYRFFENPIYVGILIQLLAWSVWMPLVFIGLLLNYEQLRHMVAGERAHLATNNFVHRGIDSILWN
jgi:protein-S-isoprenylcysteine O-methyltransferase Ste14